MSEWQDISTAPKNDTRVDIWVKCWSAETDTFAGRRVPNCVWLGGSKRWSNVGSDERATHWMPLPEPPK